jgi:predicted N-acetyltransferase YhbS
LDAPGTPFTPKSQFNMIHPKPHPAPAAPSLAVERPQDAPLGDALIERAFGPGRLVKVSERVREFAAYAPELSFCAWRGERLVGVVRQWRVRCGETPVVFLGPIAVDAEERSSGVGGLLVAAAVDAAKAVGEHAIVLVGDVPFFGRHGFAVAKAVQLPGPVDPNRVLAAALDPEGEQLCGMIRSL